MSEFLKTAFFQRYLFQYVFTFGHEQFGKAGKPTAFHVELLSLLVG